MTTKATDKPNVPDQKQTGGTEPKAEGKVGGAVNGNQTSYEIHLSVANPAGGIPILHTLKTSERKTAKCAMQLAAQFPETLTCQVTKSKSVAVKFRGIGD